MKYAIRFSALALLAVASLGSQAAGIYSATTTDRTSFTAAGGTQVTVLQVTIPAGTWQANSKVNFVNWLNKDYNRCGISVGTTGVDGATTMTGEADGFPAVATVVNEAVFTTFDTQTVKLTCSHDFNVANESLDPWAQLIVSRAPKK